MAISIDHSTKIILIPQADLTFVSAGLYELDVMDLHRWLKDVLDDPESMTLPDTHNHNAAVTLGGVTFADLIEFINGYTIEFEDGQYAVRLVGANNNIADVLVVNQVSVRSGNSAGLILVGGADPTATWDIPNLIEQGLSPLQTLRLIAAVLAGKVSHNGDEVVFRNAVADSKARVTATVDADGNRTVVTTDSE